VAAGVGWHVLVLIICKERERWLDILNSLTIAICIIVIVHGVYMYVWFVVKMGSGRVLHFESYTSENLLPLLEIDIRAHSEEKFLPTSLPQKPNTPILIYPCF
jgi:hypothetical protein